VILHVKAQSARRSRQPGSTHDFWLPLWNELPDLTIRI
jgi:hypothetical protein